MGRGKCAECPRIPEKFGELAADQQLFRVLRVPRLSYSSQPPTNPNSTMKLKFHCFHLLPVLAAGLMISPLSAQSPDRAPEPPRPEGPREAPQPDRIQAAVRQMIELKKAGKHEEAQAISQHLRQAAKDNPQVAKQIQEAMQGQRQPQPGAKAPDQPRPPMVRPNAPDQPQREMKRPNAPDQPQPQMKRPNAPDQPQPPAMRPNAPDQPQREMMQPGMPQGRQNAMSGPFQFQPRRPIMQQPYAPQGRGAAMGMRLQLRKHLMQQPYLQQGRNTAMRQFMQQRGGVQPMMRPNAQGVPQCPMMQPNAQGAPQCPKMRPQATPSQPQVVRPRVEAAKQPKVAPGQVGEVAKIRHLKVAAEQLALAGFADHAAKAREEISRMEAALKTAPAPAAKPERVEKREPKAPREVAKPKTGDQSEANAAIMGELKKLMKQVGELNARVRKLEAQGDFKGDKK